MDVESQERFNNKTSNTSHSNSSSSRDKKPEERSSLFNLSVPLTHQNLNQFIASFEKTKNPDTQIEFVNSLLKASPDVIEKFASSRGLALIAKLLNSAASNLPAKNELVDKIFIYLNKINLDKDMLTKTRIHQAVENVKNQPTATEEIQKTAFKLTVKWKTVIEEWLAEDGEKLAKKYEREQALARSLIKRTTRGERSAKNGGSTSRSEDQSPTENMDKKGRGRPVRDSRRGGGLSGGDNYLRKRKNKESYDNDDSESDLYSDNSDDYNYHDRRGVQWKDDGNLIEVKYFRKDDEPSHPGLTEEEVKKIQEEMMERAKFATSFSLTPEELKHKESLLEANSMRQKKDTEREIQSMLDAMKESISWYRPKPLKLPEDMVELGKLSQEKIEHQNRIANKLPAMYFKEYQIPDQPSFDSIINKNPIADRPILIPLCNADGEEDTTIAPLAVASDVKIQEEAKTDKKLPTKPIKGILKKKKKDMQDEEEAAREREERLKRERKKLNVDPQIVLKLINGGITQEEQEQFAKAVRESGRSEDILKNIQTIKKFLDNVQKIKANEKAATTTGSEPRKMIKTNDESQPNMMRPHFDEESDHQQQGFAQPSEGTVSGSPDTKKVSYKPHNYKTVPCVFFHSPQGCSRGEGCHFIHDWNYAGKETPNMKKYVRPNLIGGTKDESSNSMMMPQHQQPSQPMNTFNPNVNPRPDMYVNPNQPTPYNVPQNRTTHTNMHMGGGQHQQFSNPPIMHHNPPSNPHHTQRAPYNPNQRNQGPTGGNFNRNMNNQFMNPPMGMAPGPRPHQNFRNDPMYQGPPPNIPQGYHPQQQQPYHQGQHQYQQQPHQPPNMYMGNANMNPQNRPPMMNNPNAYGHINY